jgi:L-seryl-tRNA(Ser) seleniumtransferase
MATYEDLGVMRIVNADSRMTAIGGSLMPAPVIEAMAYAAKSHVSMFELQEKVGERIAALTRNEAAYVCGGAAAGIFLSILSCMTGSDPRTIGRLLVARPVRHQVVVHRAHRIPYDPAVLLAGAELVDIGNVLQTFPWELEAAFSSETAAVFFVAGDHLRRGALSLAETVEIAHAHNVPVIVDAAAQLPPLDNLWHFTQHHGADLAIFSGGKDLRGPQSSGFIVGRADLIEACRANGSPHQRLARLAKIGKEEMLGLLAAVELYMDEDQNARMEHFERVVTGWVDQLSRIDSAIPVVRDFPNEAVQPIPRARIDLNPDATGLSANRIQAALLRAEPAVAVAAECDRFIYLTPDTLEPGEESIVTTAVLEALKERTS